MAESSLSGEFNEISAEVGFYLGYGRGTVYGETAWTTAQQNAITACIKSGLRKAYFPIITPGGGTAYQWSFLKPQAELRLAEGERTIELPDDFKDFEGDVFATSPTGLYPRAVQITGIGRITQAFASTPSATGQPLFAAVYPKKGTTTLEGQRKLMDFYPAADQDYVITAYYSILPDYLTAARPYCYGGAQHYEMILSACLAAAELKIDNAPGAMEAEFQRQLAASVSRDRGGQPLNYGYNGDRSDSMGAYPRRWWPFGQAQVNPPTPV